jgi:hypothetical protein
MKINTLLNGTNLSVLLNIYNPSSDAAENPTAAVATFYQVTAGGLIVYPLIPALNLAQIVPGVWGGVANTGGAPLAGVVIIAQATVGGVVRSALMVMGATGTNAGGAMCIAVGGPRITVTPGPQVNSEKP